MKKKTLMSKLTAVLLVMLTLLPFSQVLAETNLSEQPEVKPVTIGDMTINGTGVAGATIQITTKNAPMQEVIVNNSNQWTLEISPAKENASYTVVQLEPGKGPSAAVVVQALQPAAKATSRVYPSLHIWTRRLPNGTEQISYDNINWEDYNPIPPSNEAIVIPEDVAVYYNISKNVVLEIAGLTEIPFLKFGLETLFGVLFAQPDPVVDSMVKINERLDIINQKLDELTKLVKDQALKDQLSEYKSFSIAYQEFGKTEIATLKEIEDDKTLTPEELGNQQKAFLLSLNESTINGNSFNLAVRTLGGYILKNDPRTDGKNLLSAYDALALSTYKWEHQGYLPRKAFQASTLSLYSSLASLSKLTLAAGIQDAKEKGEMARVRELTNEYNRLSAQINDIKTMAIGSDGHGGLQVLELPPDIRHYQVPGHEKTLRTVAERQIINPNPARASGFYYDHFKGFVSVVGTDGLTYSVPSAQWYQDVYKDYGSNKNLFNIFFDQTEGAFTNKPGFSSIDRYVTHKMEFWPYSWPYSDIDCSCDVITSSGALQNQWLASYKWYLFVGDDYKINPDKNFVGLAVVPKPGETNISEKPHSIITGMAPSYQLPYKKPITLSVLKGEEGYQWQVDKGNGFENITTDPTAATSDYVIKSLSYSMNGYLYRCIIVNKEPELLVNTYVTEPVTLNLTKGPHYDPSSDSQKVNPQKINTNAKKPSKTGDATDILCLSVVAACSGIAIFLLKKTTPKKSNK